MKPVKTERVTFPDGNRKFKNTIILMTVQGLVNAIAAGETEIDFESALTSEQVLDVSRWLLDSQVVKLSFKRAFQRPQDYKNILTALNHEKIEYLNFNGNTCDLDAFVAIVDFVSRANSNKLQLQTLGLEFLSVGALLCRNFQALEALKRLFNLRYCPFVILKWNRLTESHFKHFDFGNCCRLTFMKNMGKGIDFRAFLERLRDSRITHLNFGVLQASKAVEELADILPKTRIVSLRLDLVNVSMDYEKGICQLLQCRQLRYLSLFKYPGMTNNIWAALATSRLRYLQIDNGTLRTRIDELKLRNISLCGFNDSNFEVEYFQRNISIQKIIRRCAYTLMMIKRFRLDSIFKGVDINVVKMIVERLLETSHELVWMNVLPMHHAPNPRQI